MASHKIGDVRNIVLLGHGASGKTTLADLLLYKTGEIGKPGSPDDGTSHFDFDDEEKQRKSSITSAVAHFEHNGKYFQLIDTPGYPDFIGQDFGPLHAVETAVICINAHAGIEVNTRRTFELAGQEGVGRMILLTRFDTDNVDFNELLASVQETFGPACVPLTVPIGESHDFHGVLNTLALPDEIPDGVKVDLEAINQSVMDAIVEADEGLMERYLEGETLSQDEIAGGVVKAIAAGTIIPMFVMCATKDIGVTEFLDAVAKFGLSPADLKRTAKNEEGEEVTLEPEADGPLVAQVFKTRIDSFVGKMTYLRIFSGSLHKDTAVHSSGVPKGLKLHQIFAVQADKTENIEEAGPGDIVTVTKMDDLHVGDTVYNGQALVLPKIDFPTPMIALAIEPKSRSDQQKISGALSKIEEEDQTFKITRDPQTKELVMHGMSELHLQIVQDRLQHRDHVEMITHQPKIPYREAVSGAAEGSYRHKKQSGGSGQFAEVHMRISAMPHDVNLDEYFTKANFEHFRSYHYDEELNYAFVDRISGGSIPNQFIPAVEKGVKEQMEKGVLAGYQVQDVVCELFFGKDHPVDSNETAFKTAAARCFRDIFKQANPVMLEPIVAVEVTVPSDNLGDVSSDLNTRRGRVEGMDGLPGGFQVIHAKVPLAEVLTYARALSSMTGGQGSFTMDFSHYEIVPGNEQQKIVAAAKQEESDED